jgi:hypothetical protein
MDADQMFRRKERTLFMRKLMLLVVSLLITGGLWANEMPVTKAGDQPADNMQILKEKLKADKKVIVAGALQLTQNEANAFWPVYEDYQKTLAALNKRSIEMIQPFANQYNGLKEDGAKKLIADYVSIEKDRVNAIEQLVPKVRKALPEVKVMRYLQVENKIRAAVYYQVAGEIPLAQ